MKQLKPDVEPGYLIGPLLKEFFTINSDTFVEPERKGVTRGDPIGYPFKKQRANLLMVTDLDLMTIAEITENSYKVIRKWRVDQNFMKRIDDFRMDLVKFIVEESRNRDPNVNEDNYEEVVGPALVKRLVDNFIIQDFNGIGMKVRGMLMIWAIDQMTRNNETAKRRAYTCS